MKNEKVIELNKSLLLMFLSFINVGVKGFVLYKVWGWFVTPLGVPEISFVHAVGLLYVLAVVTGFKSVEQRSFEEGVKVAFERMAYYAILLVFAFVTYLVFMY